MDPAIWPVTALRVRTPRLELRPVDLELALGLAELAAAGIHDPATMPFAIPWTDVAPPELQRNTVRHIFAVWSEFDARSWRLPLAVLAGGELVGLQDLRASDFPRLRLIETGSWLGRRHQGRGIGREMRAAVLHLGFAGLGARRAATCAFADNPASLAVTRALGYRPNGREWRLRRDEPAECLHFLMEREDWDAIRRDDITVEGLGPALLGFLGLDGPAGGA